MKGSSPYSPDSNSIFESTAVLVTGEWTDTEDQHGTNRPRPLRESYVYADGGWWYFRGRVIGETDDTASGPDTMAVHPMTQQPTTVCLALTPQRNITPALVASYDRARWKRDSRIDELVRKQASRCVAVCRVAYNSNGPRFSYAYCAPQLPRTRSQNHGGDSVAQMVLVLLKTRAPYQ